MGSKVLWAVVLGFLGGVFARSLFPLSWPFAAFFLVLACLALWIALMHAHARTWGIVAAVVCAFLAVGIVRMDSVTLRGAPQFAPLIGRSATIEGIVSAEPDARENSVRLVVAADSLVLKNVQTDIHTKILVVAPAHAEISYGDRIRAVGELDVPETFDTGAGHVFNYPLYLGKDGILYELSFAQVETEGKGSGDPFTSFALSVKQYLLGGLYQAIPEPEAGLAAGITLGDKRSVGHDLSTDFVRASLIHIVVLSGYNITVVINAASAMLSYLPRIFRFGASGAVVAFFILMTGGAATSVRAGLMAFLAVYARLTGRTFIALRALGATAFLMVLWNPWTLCFDPSFDLSALATLGLVLFTSLYETRLRWVPVRFGLREIVASTLATQTTVLPLLLYQSGNLSLVALPANVLALVAVPVAMGLSVIAAIGGIVLGPYAVFVGFPAYVALAYIIAVATNFASLPFAAIQIPAFGGWVLALVYLALCAIYIFLQKKAVEHSVLDR
ncbi:MAG TPA: ComEC/Rec2 family competence protein [Candidatus Paceibacterota bacterium]|nr:ComEC/Rec2 family competence protein [Candidatus Paceibacterota bacterium]